MIVGKVLRRYKQYPTNEEIFFCRSRANNFGKVYKKYGNVIEDIGKDDVSKDKPYKVEIRLEISIIMFMLIQLFTLPTMIVINIANRSFKEFVNSYILAMREVKKMNK